MSRFNIYVTHYMRIYPEDVPSVINENLLNAVFNQNLNNVVESITPNDINTQFYIPFAMIYQTDSLHILDYLLSTSRISDVDKLISVFERVFSPRTITMSFFQTVEQLLSKGYKFKNKETIDYIWNSALSSYDLIIKNFAVEICLTYGLKNAKEIYEEAIEDHDIDLIYMLREKGLKIDFKDLFELFIYRNGISYPFFYDAYYTYLGKLLNLNTDSISIPLDKIFGEIEEFASNNILKLCDFILQRTQNVKDIELLNNYKQFIQLFNSLHIYKTNDKEIFKEQLKQEIPLDSFNTVPNELINFSKNLFVKMREKLQFDVHGAQLNILQGQSILSGLLNIQKKTFQESYKILEKYRQMEDFFINNGCVLSEDCYVFRGIKLDDLNKINNDPDTVTFVTWVLDKALTYFFSPAGGVGADDYTNTSSILLIIKLFKGTPIIRTDFDDELILKHTSIFINTGIQKLTAGTTTDDIKKLKDFINIHPIPDIFSGQNIKDGLVEKGFIIDESDKYVVFLECSEKRRKRATQYKEVETKRQKLME